MCIYIYIYIYAYIHSTGLSKSKGSKKLKFGSGPKGAYRLGSRKSDGFELWEAAAAAASFPPGTSRSQLRPVWDPFRALGPSGLELRV